MQVFTKLERGLIEMEECGSSHYWARELSQLGHDVRLIPANYVKPYVKRSKSDANDVEAICEAVTRPTMYYQTGDVYIAEGAVCSAQVRRSAGRLVPTSHPRFDCQAANTTEQHGSQLARRIWGHHSTRNWSCGQIRQRCTGGIETGHSADRNRCPETTQPSTCCHATTVPLVRDAHATAFETGQTRDAVAHNPWGWTCDCFGYCRHSRRREAVQEWSAICDLARPDTTELIKRRQRATGPDHEDRRPVHTTSTGHWNDRPITTNEGEP